MSLFTRRQALAGGASLLAAPAIIQHAHAQSGFNWRRFAGERIEVSLTANPRSQILLQNQREFEDLTGIRVGSEAIPEQQHRQKFVIEFASGRPSFDVIGISLHVNKRQVGRARWTADIKPMMADATLTAPDFDFADFGAGAVVSALWVDGELADDFAGGGVDDADVVADDEHDDAGCVEGLSEADVVELAVDSEGDAAGADAVVADAELAVGLLLAGGGFGSCGVRDGWR